jgi:N-acetylmuramoyl-L-alanine amidase
MLPVGEYRGKYRRELFTCVGARGLLNLGCLSVYEETMGLRTTIRSSWWFGGCAAVLSCAMVQGLAAKTASQRRTELTPWERAEHGLETLEAIPLGTRTRADFARAMDGFRLVYHESPSDVHSPDSVNAVAELLAEQGRELHDTKSLKDAVGQYEFLRTQYPGSSLRVGALMAEAQIYENDLHDAGASREKYALLMKQYPRSAQAEEARAGTGCKRATRKGSGFRGQGTECGSG